MKFFKKHKKDKKMQTPAGREYELFIDGGGAYRYTITINSNEAGTWKYDSEREGAFLDIQVDTYLLQVEEAAMVARQEALTAELEAKKKALMEQLFSDEFAALFGEKIG
jgi:hypothetical protein